MICALAVGCARNHTACANIKQTVSLLAFGEAIAATTASAAPSTSLKRLLLSSSIHRGAKFYNKCASCHSIGRDEPRRAGPNLWNVAFANVAAEQSFNYSLGLRARASAQWGLDTLNKFLKSPSSYAKGMYIPFSGLTDPGGEDGRAKLFKFQIDQTAQHCKIQVQTLTRAPRSLFPLPRALSFSFLSLSPFFCARGSKHC
ncbi:Cytochrome c [Candidatus Hodgkinia cicadicola]|nr:Cytochrome c [Candidatus Hodgkinia cicadicola]